MTHNMPHTPAAPRTTITVLGPGCARCVTLHRLTTRAVDQLGLDIPVEKVEDIETIMSYGVLGSPALVVNGRVLFAGRVPNQSQVRAMLAAELGAE